MRVTRSLILLSAIALAVAGCAAQPVAYVPMAAPSSLDSMAYGQQSAGYYAYPAGTYRTAAAYPTATYQAPTYQAPAYQAPIAAAPAVTSRGVYNYAGTRTVVAATAVPVVPAAAPVTEAAYTLDAGDRLRVTVFGQDGLTNSYIVGASGYIAMPLIGQVMARGETTDLLAKRIGDKLRDGFVRDPHVAVEVEAYRPFFILGEVTQPGQYPYVANMTAETAVAIAGGFTPRASRKAVTVTRNYNGQQYRTVVPVTTPIRPGDTISVSERWF
jgi:polysaccharide biosynthesis/export protein